MNELGDDRTKDVRSECFRRSLAEIRMAWECP